MTVTLAERKSRTVARLHAGFEQAAAALAAYAAGRDGRFVIFGSFARGDIHPESDCDVMVDFPTNLARDARDAAETILRDHGLIPDVHLVSEVSDGLMRRIARDGVSLPGATPAGSISRRMSPLRLAILQVPSPSMAKAASTSPDLSAIAMVWRSCTRSSRRTPQPK